MGRSAIADPPFSLRPWLVAESQESTLTAESFPVSFRQYEGPDQPAAAPSDQPGELTVRTARAILNPDIAFEPQRTQSPQRNARYFLPSQGRIREWSWNALNSRVSR